MHRLRDYRVEMKEADKALDPSRKAAAAIYKAFGKAQPAHVRDRGLALMMAEAPRFPVYLEARHYLKLGVGSIVKDLFKTEPFNDFMALREEYELLPCPRGVSVGISFHAHGFGLAVLHDWWNAPRSTRQLQISWKVGEGYIIFESIKHLAESARLHGWSP